MSSPAADSGGATPAAYTASSVPWLADLAETIVTSEWVNQSIRRAVAALLMENAPPTSDQEAPLAGTLSLTSTPIGPTGGADVPTLTKHCVAHTLVLLGVPIHWETCDAVVVETDGPQVRSVHLTVRPPGEPAPDMPAWGQAVGDRVATAEFVQGAVVGALIDAVVAAAAEAGAASAGLDIKLTRQPFTRDTTDTVTTHCHENFFSVAGHQLYHWTVCTTTTTPDPPAVHLEAIHPKH